MADIASEMVYDSFTNIDVKINIIKIFKSLISINFGNTIFLSVEILKAVPKMAYLGK